MMLLGIIVLVGSEVPVSVVAMAHPKSTVTTGQENAMKVSEGGDGLINETSCNRLSHDSDEDRLSDSAVYSGSDTTSESSQSSSGDSNEEDSLEAYFTRSLLAWEGDIATHGSLSDS